jgi:hypothetical protein
MVSSLLNLRALAKAKLVRDLVSFCGGNHGRLARPPGLTNEQMAVSTVPKHPETLGFRTLTTSVIKASAPTMRGLQGSRRLPIGPAPSAAGTCCARGELRDPCVGSPKDLLV